MYHYYYHLYFHPHLKPTFAAFFMLCLQQGLHRLLPQDRAELWHLLQSFNFVLDTVFPFFLHAAPTSHEPHGCSLHRGRAHLPHPWVPHVRPNVPFVHVPSQKQCTCTCLYAAMPSCVPSYEQGGDSSGSTWVVSPVLCHLPVSPGPLHMHKTCDPISDLGAALTASLCSMQRAEPGTGLGDAIGGLWGHPQSYAQG